MNSPALPPENLPAVARLIMAVRRRLAAQRAAEAEARRRAS